jgi:HSP20 family protein
MRQLSEDMDQLFGQSLGGGFGRTSLLDGTVLLGPQVQWLPPLELLERDGKLVIQAELPGLQAEDVSVDVTDGLVTISGERREQQESDGNGFRRTERRYGRFSRSIAIPEGVRAEDVQASFRDGVLELTVPLPQSSSPRRTVEIRTESRSEPAANDASQTNADANNGSNKNSGPGGASPGKTAGEHLREGTENR